MAEIEINGQKTNVIEGSTVIEAAQEMGVYVPHFCYHKKLSIAANCRMCLVEIEKAPKPMPACATPVSNGMKVFTHSALTKQAQKSVMEFLLINHPLDCPVCDQGGECQLQDLSVGYGGSVSRYNEKKRLVPIKEVGPLISMQEMSRCIHCTRCVRFGQELAGVMELGMVNRGMYSEIVTFVGRSVDSELSGNMIDLCPVGALTSKPFRYAARTWELQRLHTISPHDALGSNLIAHVKQGFVFRILPAENEAINECWISDKDRFSYTALNSEQRLTTPMVKQGGQWQAVAWNVALDYVAHGLADICKKNGADALAGLISPHSTLEEMFLLQKIFGGLGSQSIEHRLRQHPQAIMAASIRNGHPWLGLELVSIDNLQAALVIGSFLRKDQPLVALRLRKACRRGGLISQIGVGGDDPLLSLHSNINVAPAQLLSALGAVTKAAAELQNQPVPAGLESITTDDEASRIASSLCDCDGRRHIFLGNVAAQIPQAAQLLQLSQQLATISGATFGYLGEAANSLGGYLAQVYCKKPEHHPFAQERQAFVVFGAEPELDCYNPGLAISKLKEAKMVVHCAAFQSEAAMDYADVLLPIAPFSETSGSFVNCEGRLQSFHAVASPQGEARPGWKVLRVLGNLLDLPGFKQQCSEEVRAEIAPVNDDNEVHFIDGLDNSVTAATLQLEPHPANGLQRVADIPIYFTDPLARRSQALQSTADAKSPMARLNSDDAAKLGLADGALVQVSQAETSVQLRLRIDKRTPAGCLHLSSAHPDTANLGGMFDAISVEPLS